MGAGKQRLFLDFETFSSVDIRKCGSFKYIESPDFRVLLLAYAFDDNPVQLADLASGNPWPSDFLRALESPEVIKVAHNCAFERAVIARTLGYTPPEQWEDTMILAATCGLPMSLDAVGKALSFSEDQAKMKEGKALIRYFCAPCKPTKTNEQRTRNLPEHAPGKWQTFCEYCRRDVETMRTIYKLLARWRPSDEEHRFWCLDARINENGIKVDKQLVSNAIAMDVKFKEELMAQAVELTGLDNPKSVSQIKAWLLEQEGLTVPSLNKKVIADVVAALQTDKAKEFMAIREQLSKSSTAKYEAMLRSACADDHVKGCFQFYGANRTGRFCLTGDHEVLTRDGWVRLDEWQGGQICVWSPQSEILSFQKADRVEFPFGGELIQINAQRCQQLSTGEHKMPVRTKTGGIEARTMGDQYQRGRFEIPLRTTRNVRVAMGSTDLRVLIMVQADGHYTQEGDLKLGFAKKRKVERCRMLLRRAGIPFTENTYAQGYRTQITVRHCDLPLWLREFRNKTFGWWMLDEDASVVIDELEYWDAYRCGPNSVQYTTTNKQNADVIQALLQTNGYSTTQLVKHRGPEHPNWEDAYILNIWLTPGKNFGIRRDQMTKVPFNGSVYCATTTTGYFLVRRKGAVWITGNSGRNVQLQNLPQNHMEPLNEIRQLVRNGHYSAVKALYENVSKVLSELIRTALIPEDGGKIMVADFSAIEARVIAWFAKEQWRLDVFENGGDIYCASASQMFHVPVAKHGVNGDLRQKGKIAELALGYGGGIGALKAFGADKMGMTEEEMQETVDLWREASPRICSLWRDLERAAIRCTLYGGTVVSQQAGVRFDMEKGVLWMTLPSGRRIAYWGAKYEESRLHPGKKALSYMGVDQQTKKWSRVETWGGKLTENLVQATARDCLREAMFALADAEYDIRGHVHDEVIVSEPIDGRTVEAMAELMGRPIPWAPGLPLRADGYETPFYRKD